MSLRGGRLGYARSVVIVVVTSGLALALSGVVYGRGSASPDRLRMGPGVANHPVGVRPTAEVPIPPDWPLARDGTISCLTCHEGLPADGSGRPQLRGADREAEGSLAFCMNCHRADVDGSAAAMHWQAVQVAHIRIDSAGQGSAGLDLESRRCMGCHDGVNATEFRSSTPGSTRRSFVGAPDHDHPIGTEYVDSFRPGAGTRLRHRGALPAAVRLPGGQVGCVSCHNLYEPSPGRLSVPIEGSQLCLTCHQMD